MGIATSGYPRRGRTDRNIPRRGNGSSSRSAICTSSIEPPGAHLAVLPSGIPRFHGGGPAFFTPSRSSWTVYFGRRNRKSLWRCRVADQGIEVTWADESGSSVRRCHG
jgi:hypothetical protein